MIIRAFRPLAEQMFVLALIGAFAALGPARPAAAQTWELVWADEFDGTEIDLTKWEHEINGQGGGNNELQYYTDRPDNSFVENGNLVIQALEETFTGPDGTRNYTSARLRTLGKGDWLYGRFEVRAKLPFGQGLWPAIWMLPTDRVYGGWPTSGEIDIMELLGNEPERIYGTLHYGGPFPAHTFQGDSYRLTSGTFSDDFHVFAIEWEPSEIRWYVDDVLYYQRTDWFSGIAPFPAPFDQRFHFILNVAVGGDWPGSPDAGTTFPQRMEVDYARVFRDASAEPSVALTSPDGGTNVEAGGTLTITAGASDPDGTIDRVVFYQGAGTLGEDAEAPYELTIDNVQPGCYTVAAVATDDSGRSVQSETVDLTVGGGCSTQSPYLIAAAPIPGVIEAENFDLGGQGVGYNDLDASNNGRLYRPDEGVDLEFTADTGGGYNVGWIANREWLHYLVDVKESGTYTVDARVASLTNGGRFRLEFDGVDKTGDITFNATGGWQTWDLVRTQGVALDAGLQIMRLAMRSTDFNLNKITFTQESATAVEDEDATPRQVALLPNYPNPFNPATTLRYALPQAERVTLEVYNLLGERVATLVDRRQPAGRYAAPFEAESLSSGVYVAVLTTPSVRLTQKMLLVK